MAAQGQAPKDEIATVLSNARLSGIEIALLTILFLVFPFANIAVGHVAYHHWKRDCPAKARAVNDLSIGCFLLQILPVLAIGLICLLNWLTTGAIWNPLQILVP